MFERERRVLPELVSLGYMEGSLGAARGVSVSLRSEAAGLGIEQKELLNLSNRRSSLKMSHSGR